MIFGRAKDGKEFAAESPEVVAYREQYPDVTLEASIGSVIAMYEKELDAVSESNEEKSSDDEAKSEDADDSADAQSTAEEIA